MKNHSNQQWNYYKEFTGQLLNYYARRDVHESTQQIHASN